MLRAPTHTHPQTGKVVAIKKIDVGSTKEVKRGVGAAC
jgi:hypothetical protein